MFEAMIWGIFILIGSLIFIWTIIADLLQFLNGKNVKTFFPSILAVGITGTLFWIESRIAHDFEKPTLMKVFYDGDINGAGFDFKKDGTYIFDNSSIGLSSYTYGKYEISGNQITLDRTNLENVVVSEKLEIIERAQEYANDESTEKYLCQIDENGKQIENKTEFRLTEDNRK